MKTLVQFLLVAAFAFFANLAMAAAPPTIHQTTNVDSGDRPLGIEAEDWIPVSDKLGFVVLKTVEPPPEKARGVGSPCVLPAPGVSNLKSPPGKNCDPPALVAHVLAPPDPAAGFFMIKTPDGWRRLVVMTPADIAVAGK